MRSVLSAVSEVYDNVRVAIETPNHSYAYLLRILSFWITVSARPKFPVTNARGDKLVFVR
jgi:hypothetical protein